jgi:hypothetical protein
VTLPQALVKWVSRSPNARALAFISATKASSLPETAKASVTPASCALRSMSAISACRTLMCSPGRRPMPLSTVTRCGAMMCVLRSGKHSRASSAVMILVVDAIGRLVWTPRPYSTRPVTRSMMIADGACGTGAVRAETGVVAAARLGAATKAAAASSAHSSAHRQYAVRGPRRLQARAVCPSLVIDQV